MKRQHSASDYAIRFAEAAALEHPEVDAFERACGHAADRAKVDDAARVLACPVKINPPHWQHGRVIYAAARRRLERLTNGARVAMLDVGTAKGFSALCLLWALEDSGLGGTIDSVDVIDPAARVLRNTVAEVDGPKTLEEILRTWPEASRISFHHSTGRAWLAQNRQRIHVAFVDGKHAYEEVTREAEMLARCQKPGDVVVFDDMQIPDVAHAVAEFDGYVVETIAAAGRRSYAVATKEDA